MSNEGAIVEERVKDENGDWIVTQKFLNDDESGALELSKIVLKSPDGLKRVVLGIDNDGVLKITDDNEIDFRLLMVGHNSQSGQVHFEQTKSMRVDFLKSFNNTPSINLTLGDQNSVPPYRYWPGRHGFTIRFKISFTGVVQWTATEA